jgi:hypothetical protein
MSQSIDLRAHERRLFRTVTTGDGLIDLQLGLIIGVLPLSAWLVRLDLPDVLEAILWGIYMALTLPGLDMIRRYVIVPRRGVVRFSPERRRHLRRIFWITLGVALLIEAGMFGIGLSGISHSGYVPLTAFSLIYLTVGGVIAYVLYLPRIMAYAVLTAIAPFAGIALKLDNELYALLVPAGLMMITGLVLFVMFLQRHPGVRHG